MLRMRGLPFDVTENEILEFFNGFDVVPGSIIIGEKSQGNRTGEAGVLMVSEAEAENARASKHKQNIRNRWIELYVYHYGHYQGFKFNNEVGTSAGKYDPGPRG